MKKLILAFIFLTGINYSSLSQTAAERYFVCSGDTITLSYLVEDSVVTMKYEVNAGIIKRRKDSLEKILHSVTKQTVSGKRKRKKLRKRLEFMLDSVKPLSTESDLNFLNKTRYSNSDGRCDTLIYNSLVQLYKNVQRKDLASLKTCAHEIKKYLKTIITVEINMREMGQVQAASVPEKYSVPQGFNMKIFNDAKGFNKNQPNGLIQTEFGFSWKRPGNVKPCTIGNFNLYFFKNIVLPTVNLFQNKSDTSFRYTPVHYQRIADTINPDTLRRTLNVNTLNLIKYAHFSVSGKVNVITLQTTDKSFSLYGDVYGVFYASGISYDSTVLKHLQIKKEDSKLQVYSAGFGYGIKMGFYPQRSRFSMEASVVSFNLKLLSTNDVSQSYGKIYFPDYNSKNYERPVLNYSKTQSLNNLTIYNIQVRYSSLKNQSNTSGTGSFIRFNFYTNPLVSIIKSTFLSKTAKINYGNNYMRIQIGISKNLSDLLNFLGMKG